MTDARQKALDDAIAQIVAVFGKDAPALPDERNVYAEREARILREHLDRLPVLPAKPMVGDPPF